MRGCVLVALDLLLLIVCVAYGEFPGFALWLVLSVVGFWANRHFALKAAEVTVKAEELETRRARVLIQAGREDRKRSKKKKATPAPAQLPPARRVEDAMAEDERRFINCPECDAKNNATRATCWQCKNALVTEEEEDDEEADDEEEEEDEDEEEDEEVESSELIDSTRAAEVRRASNLRKMAAAVGPVCARCGSLNDDDAEFCNSCGRKLA